MNTLVLGDTGIIATDANVHVAYNPVAADLSFTSHLQIESIGIGLYTYSTL